MRKYHSLSVSLAIWEMVGALVNSDAVIEGSLETFNNCREQGLVYVNHISKLVIWTFAHRNTGLPTVIIGTTYNFSNMNNMFDEAAWRSEKSYTNINEAVTDIINALEAQVE